MMPPALHRLGFSAEDSFTVQKQKTYSFIISIILILATIIYSSLNHRRVVILTFPLIFAISCLVGVLWYCYSTMYSHMRWTWTVFALAYPVASHLSQGCNSLESSGITVFCFVVPNVATFLLCGGRPRSAAILLIVHAIAGLGLFATEAIFSLSCPTLSIDERSRTTNFLITFTWYILHVIGGTIPIIIFGLDNTRRENQIAASYALAESLAKSIAEMDLERVSCKRSPHPTELEKAMYDIVEKLHEVRPYIPDAVFWTVPEKSSEERENRRRSKPKKYAVDEETEDRFRMADKVYSTITTTTAYLDANEEAIEGDDEDTMKTTSSMSSIPSIESLNYRVTTPGQQTNHNLGIQKGKLTIMLVNLHNIHHLMKEAGLMDTLHKRFLNIVLNAVKEKSGIVERFGGGRVLAFWSLAPESAVACALMIKAKLTQELSNYGFSMALTYDAFLTGNVGTSFALAHDIVSPSLVMCYYIERLARKLGVPILITQQLEQHIWNHYISKPIDIVQFRDLAGFPTTVVSTVIGPKPTSDMEWMYAVSEDSHYSDIIGVSKSYKCAFAQLKEGNIIKCMEYLDLIPDDVDAQRVKEFCESKLSSIDPHGKYVRHLGNSMEIGSFISPNILNPVLKSIKNTFNRVETLNTHSTSTISLLRSTSSSNMSPRLKISVNKENNGLLSPRMKRVSSSGCMSPRKDVVVKATLMPPAATPRKDSVSTNCASILEELSEHGF